MSEKDKMIAGELYRAGDTELVSARKRAQTLLRDYNKTIYGETNTRDRLLNELLAERGDGTEIRAPFHCDYGFNIKIGPNCFLNHGCILLDICPITIGDMTQIGPYVQILAADHPRDAATRDEGLENGAPVTIGRNVWIGGGAIILPGITIGDGAIIGAGAVVTKDVAEGVTVVGTPAKPMKKKKK